MNDNHPAYALQPGARLQEFEILGVLGSGGFGITYLAQDHDLNCRVVIKEYFPRDHVLREQGSSTICPHSTKDHDFYQYGLQRFQEEARTLASFPEHPNIVGVKRFFNANASAYMVMPYVEGQTCGQWLLNNPQPTEAQLLDIFLPVLDGLRAVHQHNYLHRDIKPANIYLRSDGRPLLIDFGAARQALGEHSKSLSVVISEGYAPKEQYSSQAKAGRFRHPASCGITPSLEGKIRGGACHYAGAGLMRSAAPDCAALHPGYGLRFWLGYATGEVVARMQAKAGIRGGACRYAGAGLMRGADPGFRCASSGLQVAVLVGLCHG
jgi:serine/threonine protein kinase